MISNSELVLEILAQGNNTLAMLLISIFLANKDYLTRLQ